MSGAPETTAVIAAAGSGERLGAGGPKAFVPLAGRPILEWSLDAFRSAESIAGIVVAVPPGSAAELTASASAGVTVLDGGASRSESVWAGLAAVKTEFVAVHDAARPLVTAELIDEIVSRLAERPDVAGVLAATPITDTVKRATDRFSQEGATVAETVDREHLWAAQTPQVFRTRTLREALSGDPRSLASATDDAMLVEQAGGRILIHPAGPENLKVTTPLDLRVAEMLLSGRT